MVAEIDAAGRPWHGPGKAGPSEDDKVFRKLHDLMENHFTKVITVPRFIEQQYAQRLQSYLDDHKGEGLPGDFTIEPMRRAYGGACAGAPGGRRWSGVSGQVAGAPA